MRRTQGPSTRSVFKLQKRVHVRIVFAARQVHELQPAILLGLRRKRFRRMHRMLGRVASELRTRLRFPRGVAMTYRSPSPRVEDVEALPVGPCAKCVACGALAIGEFQRFRAEEERVLVRRAKESPLPWPRSCTPARRVSTGIFRRCKVDGSHLHESCENCGHEWLSAFGGAP